MRDSHASIDRSIEQAKDLFITPAIFAMPHAATHKRAQHENLGNNKFRRLLNERLAYDDQHFDKLFLSVYAHRFTVIDAKKNELLMSYVEVGSGNAGGLASGGSGWWAFWLIREPDKSSVEVWSAYRESARNIGVSK